MKLIIFIILLICEYGHSQKVSDQAYFHKSQIITESPTTIEDVVGWFSQGDMFEGYTWTIHPDQTFAKNHYNDVPPLYSKIDTGSWKIKRQNKLVLNSSSGRTVIRIIKIGTWRFFVFSNQRKHFDKELNIAFFNYRKYQAMPRPTDKNGAVFLIGYELSKKFSSMRLAGGT